MEKRRAKEKKDSENTNTVGKGSKNEMKSSKFFARMVDVVKADKEKKESKKRAKMDGGSRGDIMMNVHNNQSAKKFKL